MEDRNILTLFTSEDAEETWPYRVSLEREEVDVDLREVPHGERRSFSYGKISQVDDGTIHLAYEVMRRGIKHVQATQGEIEAVGSDTVIVKGLLYSVASGDRRPGLAIAPGPRPPSVPRSQTVGTRRRGRASPGEP